MTPLEYIGVAGSAVFTWFVLSEIWKIFYTSFLGHAIGRTISVKKLGSWAVVTGASDGIGKAYAEAMAARGLNVVLISRTLSKLEKVASEIEAKYKVRTKVIAVDFTGGEEIYDSISKDLEGLEIGVLVNNVGMTYAFPEHLIDVPDVKHFCTQLINCNVLSVTRMSLLILPQMVARRKGLILNISSAAALFPAPFLTMYSSTKAFVHKFSEDLALEYGPYGITVQGVLPSYVVTNMSRIKRATWRFPMPNSFVESQMKTLGLEMYSAGFYMHKILWKYYEYLGAVCRPYLLKIIYDHMKDARDRYHRRQRLQQEQKEQNPVKSHNSKPDPASSHPLTILRKSIGQCQ